MNKPLFEPGPPEQDQPKYQTVESFEQSKAVDQTELLADLSHQLEVARTRIDTLEKANADWERTVTRLQGARDALKELFIELLARTSR